MQPSHVLVPLDGSPLADAALEHALAVFDCQITVLNVVTPLDAPLSEGGVMGASDERIETAREHTDQVIERAQRRAEEFDRTVQTAVETGEPAETILDYAGDHDVDHVVMGAHGEDTHRLARRLLGTVATAVIGESAVTVTVVKDSY